MDLSEKAWDNRYKQNDIGWDLGKVSPPLKSYFDQLKNKELKILIPGGGNSYEAEYLFNLGFKNVFVVDISKTALTNLQTRIPNFPENQLLNNDFFKITLKFDLIIEQTFFCALNPNLRTTYVSKMKSLLEKDGKLVGLLFDAKLFKNRPPFGGSKKEYLTYFEPYFVVKVFDKCHNSIKSRMQRELFVKLLVKN